MNVEIGAEAAQFPEKEYINGIAFSVHTLLVATVLFKSIFWRVQCKEPKPKIGKNIPRKGIARPQSNFHIHVSVSDLYTPMIDLPFLLQEIC
jgi:hypothetical protein